MTSRAKHKRILARLDWRSAFSALAAVSLAFVVAACGGGGTPVSGTVALNSTGPYIFVMRGEVAMPGAEVFQNGVSIGYTDEQGKLSAVLATGDQLIAKYKAYEHPSPRPDHDGWIMRAYLTNVIVEDNGSLTIHTVSDPAADQVLQLIRSDHMAGGTNALIGLNLLVSANWDMSTAECNAWSDRFREMSEKLFDATDGQMLLERVEIYEQGMMIPSAEYWIDANIDTWAHTDSVGSYLGNGPPQSVGIPAAIYIPRSGPNPHEATTLLHEFGHLGFELMDEYQGMDLTANFCTIHVHTPGHPFEKSSTRAACLMDDSARPKFCSGHSDNPHKTLTWQDNDCWANISGYYSDPRSREAPEWVIRYPSQRDVLVDSVSLPPEWTVTPNCHPAVWSSALCDPFTPRLAYQDGSLARNAVIHLVYEDQEQPGAVRTGGWINLGSTDQNAMIEIVGAHPGDKIKTAGSTWTVVAGAGTSCALVRQGIGENCTEYGDPQCESGYCDAGWDSRGTNTCVPGPGEGEEGDYCTHHRHCEANHCVGLQQRSDGTWASGTCGGKENLGQSCQVGGNAECRSGTCDAGAWPDWANTNRCVPTPGTGTSGQYCTLDRQCKTGLRCSYTGTYPSGKHFGECSSETKDLGADCSLGADAECLSGYCDAGWDSHGTSTCVPGPGEGEEGDYCTHHRHCEANHCVGLQQRSDGTWAPGTCGGKKNLGQSCQVGGNAECRSGTCDAGAWPDWANTNRCVPTPGTGTSGQYCTLNRQCKPNYHCDYQGTYSSTGKSWGYCRR